MIARITTRRPSIIFLKILITFCNLTTFRRFVSDYLLLMTEKQEKILNAALELFSEEGFKATSTSKVAKRAGVSEGLIFRHFKNKDGLLEAIIKLGEERAKTLFADIVLESDPKAVLRMTFDLYEIGHKNQEEADFWKLQHKIKWELEEYGAYKLEPLENALTIAFEKLGYEAPRKEANLILLIMDGIGTRSFLHKEFDIESMLKYLKEKYQV